VASAEKYDLIVQEAAYINPRLDITDAVMKRMNASK
jgi:outer membrane protein